MSYLFLIMVIIWFFLLFYRWSGSSWLAMTVSVRCHQDSTGCKKRTCFFNIGSRPRNPLAAFIDFIDLWLYWFANYAEVAEDLVFLLDNVYSQIKNERQHPTVVPSDSGSRRRYWPCFYFLRFFTVWRLGSTTCKYHRHVLRLYADALLQSSDYSFGRTSVFWVRCRRFLWRTWKNQRSLFHLQSYSSAVVDDVRIAEWHRRQLFCQLQYDIDRSSE